MTSLAGQVLDGRYRLEAPLAETALGTVYRAQQLSLGRSVSVKVIKKDVSLQGGGLVAKFEREAQVLARLEHPGIVRIHEFGRHEGTEFIVTELVEGLTLEQVLTPDERLDAPDAILVLRQLAAALAHAHAQNVVHRDLNPSNVLVAQDGTVKILDFGLARLVNAGGEDQAQQTALGMMIGSPYYMSPEQCRGQPVTHSTDIYSLGAIAYRVLAGTPPFPSKIPMQVMRDHVTESPKPLGELVGVQSPKDEALFYIVHQLLQKDPSHRPQSAQAVKEMLDSIGEGLRPSLSPPGAGPSRPLEPALETKASRQQLLTGVVAAIAVAAAAAAYLLLSPGKADIGDTVQRSLQLVSQGRSEAAILELAPLASDGRGRPEVHAALGHALMSSGSEQDALAQFERAAAADPEVFQATYLKDMRALFLAKQETLRVDATLLRLGKQGAPFLREVFDGSRTDQATRLRAGIILEKIGEQVDLVPLWLQALRSSECSDREEAIRELRRLGDARALPDLKRYAKVKKCGSEEAKAAYRAIERKSR